jgi:hypothetical protein
MARNDCPDGSIIGGTFDEVVIDEIVSCSVMGVLAVGEFRVENADNFTNILAIILWRKGKES